MAKVHIKSDYVRATLCGIALNGGLRVVDDRSEATCDDCAKRYDAATDRFRAHWRELVAEQNRETR